jgi:hypothetical protein
MLRKHYDVALCDSAACVQIKKAQSGVSGLNNIVLLYEYKVKILTLYPIILTLSDSEH